MNRQSIWKFVEFIIIAYFLALLIDYSVYISLEPISNDTYRILILTLWGFIRMWSVALAVTICLLLHRINVIAWFKSIIGISKDSLVYYFLSPLLVYLALGVYILISSLLGFFSFEAYVNEIASRLREAGLKDVETFATLLAIVQIPLGYIAAISINAFFAMGEEIGWRGYLYKLLDWKPNLPRVFLIGIFWGLWHASAILLLGYNYAYNRVYGVFLFTALTIAFTYPLLLFSSKVKSILPACSLHGAINALWPATILTTKLPYDQRELLLGLGFLGIITWMVISILVYLKLGKNEL